MKIILTFFILSVIILKIANNIVAQNKKARQKPNVENIAVLIGVANYLYDSSLDNTINDARSMAEYFHSIGYNTVLLLDPTKKQVEKSTDSVLQVMSPEATFVFFAAAHGSEYKAKNYIALVDSKPMSNKDLPRETFCIQKLFKKISTAKIRTTISFLDICRTPLREKFREPGSNRFIYTGFTRVNSPAGSFTGFSTSSGKSAKDATINTGNHSPFTFAMLEYIRVPYLSIEEFYDSVIIRTKYLTQNVQTPIKESNLEGSFYFNLRYKTKNDSTIALR
ncbi:hypothetical protein GFS24_17655 [Chitinophaga sp. SYP-B3965]|uniref:caspase family protein n=1 Tax=Chitinophaga sp. SYP-B3965 TaxID=2663120 RepID=UPI001299F066|nr:caspase family protein [Chitinophaga sp. SYP-B3965]MRG46952.1 hypothetical protein [Chitinophaga sp. SYP-B3965]